MRLFKIMDTAFENFDNSVRKYLQKTFNDLGFNYTHNQVFGVIFDGIKGIMQNIMFYIEDAFTEQNVFTAKRKRSLYSLAKLSGYEPSYGTSASGTIFCKLKQNNVLNSSKIYVYNETTLVNKKTGIIYSIVMPTNYYIIDSTKPLMIHEFKIVQGTFKNATYVASGTELETINITSISLYDANYLTVTINGEEWTPVSNLYEMTENSKNYIITSGYDNNINIMFGNGVHGKILDPGSSVMIKYLNHNGVNGNINLYDTSDFQFISVGYDTEGESVNLNDYCIVNINKLISGGSDADSINFVRNMIGYNSRSNVLASEENFKLFLKRFSFIGQSTIKCEENSACIAITALTQFFSVKKTLKDYFTTDIKNFYLNDDQKNIVKTTLKNSNKGFAGTSVVFHDPIIRQYAIICYVNAKNVYSQDAIKDNIKDAITKYFLNLPINTTFIPKSDIINEVLKNDDNIKSIDIQFVSKLAEDAFYEGYYYTYKLTYTNHGWTDIKTKIYYEPDTNPGLDKYGNISLTSSREIPLLRGSFNYYPTKNDTLEISQKNNSINMETIQVIFI